MAVNKVRSNTKTSVTRLCNMETGFAAIEKFFADRNWIVADFQKKVWNAYLKGKSGVLSSATGSGKTLAVIGGPLIEAVSGLESSSRKKTTKVLWVTPLRALASDTVKSIKAVADEMGLNWDVIERTGDSGSRDRRLTRQGKAEIIVITPESLALLLTYPETENNLKDLRCVVVDELHELLANKRGVLLQLSLSVLYSRLPKLRVWGLSATIGNLEVAGATLSYGSHNPVLMEVRQAKRAKVSTLIPDEEKRLPWSGHLGLSHLDKVYDIIMQRRTSLVFTNTRAQSELWFKALHSIWRDSLSEIALHHGSLDPSLRKLAEAGLKSGDIRCVVATSSLDLGVDFPAVDQVIQIGSPKGVSRLIQRAGRARHRPGESGEVICVPSQALDLLEYTAARRAIKNGSIEQRTPLVKCWDVLVQHCVSLALAGGLDPTVAFAIIKKTYAYADITFEEFQAVIDFLVHGGSSLEQYPDYHRLILNEDGLYVVPSKHLAMRHRMSIGTIASDGSIGLKMLRGGRLGSIEEGFISRLKPGERFVFSGKTLELVRVDSMMAYVRNSKKGEGIVPTWQGGRMPLSNALASEIQSVLADVDRGQAATMREPEINAISSLLSLQRSVSALPTLDLLLVESCKTRRGFHVFIYPFAGRSAHEGMANLFAWRWARIRPNTFSYSLNDYGIMLTLDRPETPTLELLGTLLDGDNLMIDLRESVNMSELCRRHFREIARVSGLVAPALPGGFAKSMRQVQASSGLLYDVFKRYDPEHILLQQAEAEVLEYELEYPRIQKSLEDLRSRTIKFVELKRLAPFSFPLWADGLRGQLSNEDWKVRIARAAEKLESQYG